MKMTWTDLMKAMVPGNLTVPDPATVTKAKWAVDPVVQTLMPGSTPTGYDYWFKILNWPNHDPQWDSFVVFNANVDIKDPDGAYGQFIKTTSDILASNEVMSPQSFWTVAQVVHGFGMSLGGWKDRIDGWLPGIATADADLQGDSAAALRSLLSGIKYQISDLGRDMGVDGGANEVARLINAAGDGLNGALTTLRNNFASWASTSADNTPMAVLRNTYLNLVAPVSHGTDWDSWLDWNESGSGPTGVAVLTSLDGTWVGKSDQHTDPTAFGSALDDRAKANWTQALVTLDGYAQTFATTVDEAFKPLDEILGTNHVSQFSLGAGPGATGPGPGIGPGAVGPGPGAFGPGPGAFGPGPGAVGPGPGANAFGPGPGAVGPGPGAVGPGPGANAFGPGPGAVGPGPGTDGTGPGANAFGPGPGAFGPGPGADGTGPGTDGTGPGANAVGPGPGAFGPGPGANAIKSATTGPGSGNLPGVDDILHGASTVGGIGPGGGLGGGLPTGGGAKSTVGGASTVGPSSGGPGPGAGFGGTNGSTTGGADALVRPLVGPDGQTLRTPSGDVRTVPDGASVTADGQVLDAHGDPLLGPDGAPQTAPPGSTLGDPQAVTTGGLDVSSGGDNGGLDDWGSTGGANPALTSSHFDAGSPNGTFDNPPGGATPSGATPSTNVPSLDDFEHRAAALANTSGPSFGGPGPGSTLGHSGGAFVAGPGSSHLHTPGGGLGGGSVTGGSSGHGPGPGGYGPGPGVRHEAGTSNLFTAGGADATGTPSGGGSNLTFSGDSTGTGTGAAGTDTSGTGNGGSTPYGPGPGMGMGPGPGGSSGSSGGGVRGGGTGAPISSRSITEELSAPTAGRAGSSGQSGMPMMPMSGGPGPGKDDKRRTSSTVVTEDNEEVWSTVNEETGRSLGR